MADFSAAMMTSAIRRTSSRTGAMTAPRMRGPKYRRRHPLSSSRIVSPASSRRLPNVSCATPDRHPDVTIGSPAKKSEPCRHHRGVGGARHRVLGDAGPDRLEGGRRARLGDPARLPDERDLLGRLDRAPGLDEARAVGGLAQEAPEPVHGPRRDEGLPELHADAPVQPPALPQHGHRLLERILVVREGLEVAEPGRRLRDRALHLPDEQERLRVLAHDEHAEVRVADRLVPAQVRDVLGRDDQEDVEGGGPHPARGGRGGGGRTRLR